MRNIRQLLSVDLEKELSKLYSLKKKNQNESKRIKKLLKRLIERPTGSDVLFFCRSVIPPDLRLVLA